MERRSHPGIIYIPSGPPHPDMTPSSSSHTLHTPGRNTSLLGIELWEKQQLGKKMQPIHLSVLLNRHQICLLECVYKVKLTTHPAFQNRPWPAVQLSSFTFQRLGVGYNHLGRHVEAGERLLTHRPFKPIGQLLKGPQQTLLTDYLCRVVPRRGQWDACWEKGMVLGEVATSSFKTSVSGLPLNCCNNKSRHFY